ncbi:MAG: thiamine-phosphate pyrophosphorylase [Acidobacteria bacterium]|nr:thiamine-phosphate pyrophosphorylase [Acidobacteriota bacterium]
MHILLPKIYPITDARLSAISHAEQVEKLIEGGANFIQLREKYAAPIEFYKSAEIALKSARKHNVKIIINDRVDIALALKADGVHLGQEDISPVEARKILGDKAIIGFSTHSVEQAIEAIRFPIDYVAIGPVYATKTKENPDAVVGIQGLKKVREAIGNFPLVAIGGINSENLSEVYGAGADSAAIVSGLLSDADKINKNYEVLSSL